MPAIVPILPFAPIVTSSAKTLTCPESAAAVVAAVTKPPLTSSKSARTTTLPPVAPPFVCELIELAPARLTWAASTETSPAVPEEAVPADPPAPVAQGGHGVGTDGVDALGISHQDEVIAGAVPLGEAEPAQGAEGRLGGFCEGCVHGSKGTGRAVQP